MKTLSPGVYTNELDFSFYAMELASSIYGIVCTADKGPINEVTLITNEGDLVDVFGVPRSIHYGLLAGIRYLRKGRALKVVRVAGVGVDGAAASILNEYGYAAMDINATSDGSWGNLVDVRVAAGTNQGYKITVYYNDAIAEVFNDVLITPVTDSFFIETVINGNSKYITVSVTDGSVGLALGLSALSGGDSGSTVTASDIVGTQVGNSKTGLQLFANGETVDINMLSVPGFSNMVDPSDQGAIIEEGLLPIVDPAAGGRGDCVALISVPYGLTVQEAIDWHNGNLSGYLGQAINSSYAAIYAPWLNVYNSYSNSELWVPSDGSVAGVCAYTDEVRELWFAPAGLQRGRLPDVLDTEYSPDLGQRDAMYGGLNRINPIVNFEVDGVAIYGQQTAYRANSALTSLNVRRLLNYVEKVTATSVRYLVFEPNDFYTWLQFKNIVDPIFRNIKARRGFYDYRIICDATTNTPARIDKGEMWGRILMQPTKAAEKVAVEFAVTQTGANFDEFTDIA